MGRSVYAYVISNLFFLQDTIIDKIKEILADIYVNNERDEGTGNNNPRNTDQSTLATEPSTNLSDSLEIEQDSAISVDLEIAPRQPKDKRQDYSSINRHPNQNHSLDIDDSPSIGNTVVEFRSPPSTNEDGLRVNIQDSSRKNVDSFSLSDSDSVILPPKVIMELTDDEPFSPIAKSTQKVIRCGHELEKENIAVIDKLNCADNDVDFMKKKSPDIARTYSVMANTAHIVDAVKGNDKMSTEQSGVSEPEVVVVEDINASGDKEESDTVQQVDNQGSLTAWSKGHSVSSNSAKSGQVSMGLLILLETFWKSFRTDSFVQLLIL